MAPSVALRPRRDPTSTKRAGPRDPMKRVLLIIGGGIAAYKCLDLIRRLGERGVAVRCVMTEAAQAFITPLAV
jgi:phosphopantothenoylcysteine decarboxylase/phosphopantothenate--cysteine ligase